MKSPATPPAFAPTKDTVVAGYRHATGRTVGHHQPTSAEAGAQIHRFTVGGIYLDTVAPALATKAAAEATTAAKKSRTAADKANDEAAAAILAAEEKATSAAPTPTPSA